MFGLTFSDLPSFLKTLEHLLTCRAFPFVPICIKSYPIFERFLSHDILQLFQERCTLAVCNAIYLRSDIDCIFGFKSSRVRFPFFRVDVYSPVLVTDVLHPFLVFGIIKLFLSLQGFEGHERSVSFYDPKIVPPFWGYYITEPLMGNLVQNCIQKHHFPVLRLFFLWSCSVSFFVVKKLFIVRNDALS